MALSFSETELAGKNLNDLFRILYNNRLATPEDAAGLNPVLRACFDLIEADEGALDPEAVQTVMQMSDYFAVKYGLDVAVRHYKQHLNIKDWTEDGELKYSFKNENGPGGYIHKALRAKIVGDIAYWAGTADIKDIDNKELVGIKIKDTTVANNVVSELKRNSPIDPGDLDKMTDEEKDDSLSWWRNLGKEGVDTAWSVWQKTWDKAQKAILGKDTLPEVGEEMCLQIFLLPFKMFENYMAKLDDWAKDFAKKRNAILLTGGAPDPVPTDPDPKDPKEPPKELKDVAEFMALYVNAAEEEGKTDPDRKKFAEELRGIWNHAWKNGFTKEEFNNEHAPFPKKLYADFDHGLVDNIVKVYEKLTKTPPEELNDLDCLTQGALQRFFQADFFPDRIKNNVFDKLAARGVKISDKWYDRTKHDDKGPDKDGDKGPDKDGDKGDDTPDKDGKKRTTAKGRAKVLQNNKEELRAAGEARAVLLRTAADEALKDVESFNGAITQHKGAKKGHVFGSLINRDNHTITRYHKDGDHITTVTYFTETGKAVIIDAQKDEKTGEFLKDKNSLKVVEGLNDGPVLVNGRAPSDKVQDAWKRHFTTNKSLYAVADRTGFKDVAMGLRDQQEWSFIKSSVTR